MARHDSRAKMSGLSLADAERDGKHGAALIPGKPDGSLLIQAVSGVHFGTTR